MLTIEIRAILMMTITILVGTTLYSTYSEK